MIKGLLFDKDGTLLDFRATWMPAYHAAANEVATRWGRSKSASALLESTGYDSSSDRVVPGSLLACGSNAEIADVWQRDLEDVSVSSVLELMEATFMSGVHTRLAPVTQLGPFFESWAARGFKLGVATMDSEAIARLTLKNLGALESMDYVCGYDSGHGVKPDPGMVLGFCEATKLLPHEVVMIGDSVRDLEMGRQAKSALVVGVLTGASRREDLEPWADHVLTDITKLFEILELQHDVRT